MEEMIKQGNRAVRLLNLRFMLCLFVGLLAFSSCTTNRYTRLLQDRKSLPQYTQQEMQRYRIQVDDELKIKVLSLNKEALEVFNSSGIYRVYADGTIDLPFMDSIKVVGLTLEEANVVLQKELKKFIIDAEVIVALSNNYFYVFGEGGNGAIKLYKEKITIYQALAMSGGVKKNANRKNIYLMRKDEKGITQTMTFDIRPKSIIGSEYYYIQPNDIIYIPPTKGRFFRMDSLFGIIGVVTTSVSLFFLIYGLSNDK
ncbi:MAG TPA: polysaccharide biosynthesis/export family protein [Paludibacteraceae bacterium]|nr:polysaccharide biosynthesis/export family protein [Paludibacteraceae bacterium]HPH63591.1 polysaccharide biosynthesis/export family protein [Paludibacteraceae bacterium]